MENNRNLQRNTRMKTLKITIKGEKYGQEPKLYTARVAMEISKIPGTMRDLANQAFADGYTQAIRIK